MAARIRDRDWAATPLGAIRCWPASLKTIVDLMIASPSMMSLVWGAEAIHLYNDAFTELLREHHIEALGRSAFESFARSRSVFAADIAAGMAGQSARLLAQRYPVLRDGQLQDAWFDVDYAPVRDESGDVAGVLWTLKETTTQVLAERALRESDARHSLLIGTWAQAVWETDANGVVVADSPSWRAYTGQRLDEWLGYGWLDAIHPDDRAYAEQQWREAIAVRGLLNADFRLRNREGGFRWTNVRAAPVLDHAGGIEKWAGMNIDIDDLKRSTDALQESEERQKALIDGIPQLVWRAGDPGVWTWASPQWTAFTGQREDESHDWGWLAPVHPDDRAVARAAWDRARAAEQFTAEYRIRDNRTGVYRWFQTRATPVCDPQGAIVEWLGTSTDVDDLRRLQEQQQTLVKELQHRTFNLMGMVRSTADATIRSSATLDEFRTKFRDRIGALARVQRLLSRLEDDNRIGFGELLRAELEGTGALELGEQKVTLAGPPNVPLRSGTVQTFAMALHELTTNAVKYGALHQSGGHLHVRWWTGLDDEAQRCLYIDWRESGVTMPPEGTAPQGTGQGRALIEKALPYQLQAKTTYVMARDGVHLSLIHI